MHLSWKITGRILLYIGIYFAVQVLAFSIVSVCFGIKAGIENRGMFSQEQIQTIVNQNIHWILIGSVLSTFGLYWLIFRVRKESLIKRCNFTKIGFREMGYTILLGFGFNAFLVVMNIFTNYYRLFPEHEKLMISLIGGNIVLTLITVGIVIPVFEEILFRGIVFNELRKWIRLPLALILQGLVFGLYHMNVLQGIYGTLMGILAALAYVWVGSLWAPILVHAGFNLIGVFLSRLNEQILVQYSWGILFFSILILAYALYTAWKRRIINFK